MEETNSKLVGTETNAENHSTEPCFDYVILCKRLSGRVLRIQSGSVCKNDEQVSITVTKIERTCQRSYRERAENEDKRIIIKQDNGIIWMHQRPSSQFLEDDSNHS